jgi:cell division septal protein FtsQ
MDGLAAPRRTAPVPRLTAPGLRRLLLVTALLCVLGAGWLWLRDSPLVGVREVLVTGVTSSQEAKVREALRSAAMDMTTLNVREEQLRTAVAPYASVADLEVDAGFPHRLSIEVVERRPAAIAVAGGERVP